MDQPSTCAAETHPPVKRPRTMDDRSSQSSDMPAGDSSACNSQFSDTSTNLPLDNFENISSPSPKPIKVAGGTHKPRAKPFFHSPTCCNDEAMCKKYGPPIQLQPAHYARLLYANPVCILTSCDPASFIPEGTSCCEPHCTIPSAIPAVLSPPQSAAHTSPTSITGDNGTLSSPQCTATVDGDAPPVSITNACNSIVATRNHGGNSVGETIPVDSLIHQVLQHDQTSNDISSSSSSSASASCPSSSKSSLLSSISSLTRYSKDSLYNINHRRINVMTISWLTPTTNAQGGIMLSMHADRYSAALVLKNKRFCLNIPVRGMETMVRNIGANTGRVFHQEKLEGMPSEGGIRDLDADKKRVKEANDTVACVGEGVMGNKPDISKKNRGARGEVGVGSNDVEGVDIPSDIANANDTKAHTTTSTTNIGTECLLKSSRNATGKKGDGEILPVTSPSGYQIIPGNKFALLGLRTCRPGWRAGPDYAQPLIDKDGHHHTPTPHDSTDSGIGVGAKMHQEDKHGRKKDLGAQNRKNPGKAQEDVLSLQQKATLISDLHGDIAVSDCVAHLVCTIAHVLPPLELQPHVSTSSTSTTLTIPAATSTIAMPKPHATAIASGDTHEASMSDDPVPNTLAVETPVPVLAPSQQSVVNISRAGTPIMGMGTSAHITLFCTIEAAWVRKGYWGNGTFAPTKPEFPPYLTFFGGGVFGYSCTEQQMKAAEEKYSEETNL